MNDISQIAALPRYSDAEAARLVSDATHVDLVQRITATQATSGPRRPAKAPRRRSHRRWLVGVPVAAVLGTGLLVVGLLGGQGKAGPFNVGPAKAAALTFSRHGHFIYVIVRNPVADARMYRAEFKAHGLDIALRLIPASPSLVGTVVYVESTSAIKVITAKGRCYTGGGGDVCPVGLRVPVNYRGSATLVFGRAARLGERYESTTSATAPGEVLHGLAIQGRTVAAVLTMARARQVTVPVFHVLLPDGVGALWPPRRVPGSWYVYAADPWAPGQVMLWVGRTRTQPSPAPPSPRTPVASPAPGHAAKHRVAAAR